MSSLGLFESVRQFVDALIAAILEQDTALALSRHLASLQRRARMKLEAQLGYDFSLHASVHLSGLVEFIEFSL
jgi:hypothetical protein